MKFNKLLLVGFIVNILLLKTASAQISVEEAMNKKHLDCKDVFLNAIDIIPQLYRTKEFDSLQKAIDIWKSFCGNTEEIQYTELLMSIERSTFDETHPDSNLISLLNSYSLAYRNSIMYNDSNPYSTYYKISSAWAKLLLARTDLTKTETFICNVLAGVIKEPTKEIRTHKDEYSTLYAFMNKEQAAQKKLNSAEYTFITGIWSPTKNAAILGAHPSLGFQLGGRFHVHHQVDFTVQFRFLKSAGVYTVKRSDSLYNLNHFFGGYIGGDYTYYFVSKAKTDIGIVGGIGFDGFDIADDGDDDNNDSHKYDYLKPLSINSFNFNTGLRFNYFFSSSFYLGLQGRYNFVHYNNRGGTDLSGNTFCVDLIIGITRVARENYY